MLRKKVFLYVSFVKSVQFVCAIIVTSKKTSKFSLNEGVAYWRDALQR